MPLSSPQFVFFYFMAVSANAASIGGATGNYDNDLGQVLGAARAFTHVKLICNEEFPELTTQSSAALADWERRNRTTLNEVNSRWQAHIKELSGSSKDREFEISMKLEAETRDAERAVTAYLTKMPPDKFRSVCLALPTTLQSPDRDLENSMKSQLQSIRARQYSK